MNNKETKNLTTIEENKRKIDEETASIIYNESILRIKIEQKTDYLTDYINKMIELRTEILNKSKNEESFNNHKSEIVKLLYDLGSLFFCFYSKTRDLSKIYNKTDNIKIINPFTSLSTFPGCHDFNVCLSRCFTWECFNDFYKLWLDDINVFLESKSEIFPRFLHVITKINKSKGNEENPKPYIVNKFIFVTKEDLGWNPPEYLNLKGTERTKEKLEKFLEYKRDWKFEKCTLPAYIAFYDKLPKKEKYKELYKNVFGEKYEGYYIEFLEKEYILYEEFDRNHKFFESLKNIDIKKED